MIRKRISAMSQALCLALACAIPFQDAHALLGILYGRADVNVKTHSEIIAGLDEPTRKLIQGFPLEVQTQIVELLKQSLPLLNRSVSAMLQDVDTRLERRINQAVCSGQALGQGMADEVKAVFTGSTVHPSSALVADYDLRIQRFESRSARSIAARYEDFLHRAAITACRAADNSVIERANNLRLLGRERWRTWTEIEAECESPSHCLVKRHSIIAVLLKTADSRDLAEVGAAQSFVDVKAELPPGGWLGMGSPDWTAVEDELLKLRRIERAVSAAEGMRLSLARTRMQESTSTVATSETAMAAAENRLAARTIPENNAAAKESRDALPAKRAELVANIDLAVQGDASLKDVGSALKARLTALDTRSSQVQTKAAQSTASITEEEKRRVENEAKRKAEADARARDRLYERCIGARRAGCPPT